MLRLFGYGVYLTFLVWSLYLTIKVAEHVNAWPF